ncbi:MAG: DUF721 domain-containing protein [Thermodesulfobacteriota bacterium]
MTDRPPSDLTSLGRIIDRSLEEGFLGLAREMLRVFEVWEEAVGGYNASKAAPESVKNGRLTVLVQSPVWIDRFGYLKAEFIKNVNQALGAPLIKEITFRVGPVPEKGRRGPEHGQASPGASGRTDSPLVREAVAGVQDPELRERLAGLLARQRE